MAFYGDNPRPEGDPVPDWLMGGNRKRRVLAALADGRAGGWRASELASELACGRATVYEIVRALRPLGVVAEPEPGRVALDDRTPLGAALVALVRAAAAFEAHAVDRPPRVRG